MSDCTHAEELRAIWDGITICEPGFCGLHDPHAPHGDCLGIMCDYGCNAEDF